MYNTAIDTYAFIKRLRDNGLPEIQAQVIIQAILDSREYDLSTLVTKEQFNALQNEVALIRQDIVHIRSVMATKSDIAEIRIEISELKSEMKSDIAELRNELKSDIAEIKVSIADIKTDILKWIVPLFIAMLGMMVTILLRTK
jgi:protein subunit release factor A